MTDTIFKRQSANAGIVMFANPANVAHTLRASVKSAPKNILGGGKAQNVQFALVNLKPATITRGSTVSDEQLSVRITTSGSVDNAELVLQMLDESYAKAKLAVAEGALKGFVPDIASL